MRGKRNGNSGGAAVATIYETIGGENAVRAAVEGMYVRILGDVVLRPFFAGVNMKRLKEQQVAFFSQALGGPARYKGPGMRELHAGLHIEQRHFDRVAQHLVASLKSLHVDDTAIDEIVALVQALAAEIVNTVSSEDSLAADNKEALMFQQMVENSPINVMRADADFIIRYMNAASKRTLSTLAHLLPCKVDDVLGSSIDIFHKNPAHPRRLLSDPKNLPHQANIQLGPETLSLLVSPIYDAQQNYLGPMVTWDVVTEKLRLEVQNADYAGQIAAIGKSQAVVEFQMDGTVVQANENFLKALGYTLEEVKGKHHSMFVDEAYRQSADYKEFWAKLNRGEYQAAEYKRLGKGGTEVWIQASCNPIMDLHGKPFKVVKYATDVTQQKLALNAMLADAAMLSKAAVEGKLATRADAGKHQGDYRKVVEGVNATLDAVIGPLNVAADFVDKISKGEIPPKITNNYNGDFNTIKNNLNQCIDAVNALVADAGMLSKAAVEGKLATRADAGMHQGDYRKIVQGVNETLDAVIGPLNVAAKYVDQISKGDVPPKITDTYNGDFNTIKNNLNACIDGLGGLVEANEVLQLMAANDYTRRVRGTYQGVFAEVGKATNKTADTLRGSMETLGQNAQALSSSAEELTATSQQMSANAEETSAQANVVSAGAEQVNKNLQTVATGTEEMSASIKEIAKNAHESAKVATSAVKVAEDTNQIVSKLGDSSTEIGQVIKVITSIAQQTNLLALNATIEAARAGEAGKGFAVVANEVKELAKQTAKATEDISRKIEAIQGDTKSAVDAISQIGEVIKQVNDISNTIATAVEEQNATTNEMSRNVSEAARGSGEISQNIAGVAEAAKSTTHGANDSLKAAQSLAQMSTKLRELVSQFKIENDAHSGHQARPQASRAMSAGAGS
ncbi:MAG: PAS domain S-box protein [Acidobacteriales bacterium]|nr:PAS domain S-box protein [Terriglobales bacterium]